MSETESLRELWLDVGSAMFGCEGFTDAMITIINERKLNAISTHILEAGCGSGKMGLFFALHGLDYTGIDIDRDQLIKAARIRGIVETFTGKPLFNAKYYEGDIHHLNFADNSFDVVFDEGVIEHWLGEEQQNAVDEMVRVCRNTIIIFVPDADSPISREIAEKTIHTYKGMGEKEYPMTMEQLYTVMEGAGLKNITVKPVTEKQIVGAGYKK